jgi:enoyl-CoA hydratase/carnithine racemase
MTGDYLTAEIAEEAGVITETIEVPTGDGPAEKQIDVYEASVEELAELEEREQEGVENTDLIQEVFDEYLAQPSGLDAESVPSQTQDAIFRGILRAWGASDDAIEAALDELQGN